MSDLRLSARFAQNMLRHRKEAGLSQERVALRSGLHRTEISILERGFRMPQLNTIVRIAGGLGIAPCELLEGMAWRPGDLTPGGFEPADEEERDSDGRAASIQQ